MKIHRVKNNETVYDIAGEYGVSPVRLGFENEIGNPRRLATGRELLVQMPTRTYNVRRDDTEERIALRFGISPERIRSLNPELASGGKLYSGQLLVIKSMAPTLGMGIANGYYYQGCPREYLMRALPYLSYITVCSAIAEGGKISTVFDDSYALDESKRHGKIILLRIYVKDDTNITSDDFISSATLLAKSRGYDGITLPAIKEDEGALKLKKAMLERELLLFVERELKDTEECCHYADATVLTYDKIHLDNVPSFDDGERAAMERYAEMCHPEGAFIDLSPFALAGEKYIEKTRAYEVADRNKNTFSFDKERLLLTGDIGRGRRSRHLISESLENTKAKLQLIGELGYLGISFDIMRTPLAELLMFANLYSQPPSVIRRVVCNPPD